MSEFVKSRPQCIDEVRALVNEALPVLEEDGPRLLVFCLGLYKAHFRPLRRNDDCLSIIGIILVTLDEWCDILR